MTSILWPFTLLSPITSSNSRPKGSCPSRQICKGASTPGNASAGHSTNLAKLKRNAALT